MQASVLSGITKLTVRKESDKADRRRVALNSNLVIRRG